MSAAQWLRFQRITLALAFAWAGLALVFFVRATLFHEGVTTPIHTSNTAGRVSVTWAAPAAEAAGVRPGDELVSIDGLRYLQWGRDGHWRELTPGKTNVYHFRRRDGSDLSVALEPVPTSVQPLPQVPIYVASFVVASAFLAMGVLVWLLRRGREEAWAFGLFSSFIAVQLFTAFDTYRQTAGYERAAINFFLLAAASSTSSRPTRSSRAGSRRAAGCAACSTESPPSPRRSSGWRDASAFRSSRWPRSASC